MKRILSVLLALALAFGALGAFSEAAAKRFSQDYAAMNEAAASALILTACDGDGYEIGTFSGFIAFDASHAITLTAALDGASSLNALDDNGNDLGTLKVLASDTDTGIAILAFDEPTGLQPLPLSDTTEVKRGAGCVSIGAEDGYNAINTGNISSFFTDKGVGYIQFTAPLSANAAGGVLLDDSGEAVGIAVESYESPYGIIQNLNYAIRIAEAVKLWELCREDEAVEVGEWTKTDIGINSTMNAAPRDFTIKNAIGRSIITLTVYAMQERTTVLIQTYNWVRNEDEVTFTVKDDAIPIGDETVTIRVSYSDGKHNDTIERSNYQLGDLLGKTLSLTVTTTPSAIILTEINTGEDTYVPRHVKEIVETEEAFTLPETIERSLPDSICVIINDTDKWITNGTLIGSNTGYRDDSLLANNIAPGDYTILELPEEYLTHDDQSTWIFSFTLQSPTFRVYIQDRPDNTHQINGALIHIKFDTVKKQYYADIHFS